MSTLTHPAVLRELAVAGERGLRLLRGAQLRDEIEDCRRWGFRIDFAGDRVRLVFDDEQLVPEWLRNETPLIAWESLSTAGFLRLASTNTQARLLAEQGSPEGTLVFAEQQTGGKGRQNRSWHSPAGAGLYCTLIVRPKQPRRFWPLLTHAASVALVTAIGELPSLGIMPSALEAEIKWPNDVLLSGKKCAGILLEALWDDAKSAAALVGFGINVHCGSVPEDLADEAACLDTMANAIVPRRKLLALYLKHFQNFYLMFEEGRRAELLDRWKKASSMWNGANVYIGKGEGRREAVTCGLDDSGALRIRNADGSVETLLAEDVSVSRKRC